LRETLLAAEQPSIIINEKINIYDNSAIEILRIIEAQKNLISKCTDYWNKFLENGVVKMCEIIPGAVTVPSHLEVVEASLRGIKNTFESLIIEKNNFEHSQALQCNEKLMELLNKY
jgi:hypothetical protein